jgi:CheY-like chemotaxis protein
MLHGGGHEVRTASSGPAGLYSARTDDVDAIFCALFMPGNDGVETIRDLRRDVPGIPVIVMSSGQHGQTDLLPVARSLGIAAVLPKPFSMADVFIAMRAALHDSSSLPATEG